MTEQGRPTGIQYEDAADAAMHGGSVDFEGRKVRVLSLNSKTGTDEAPSAQLDLDLGEEYLVLIGYFWDGKFMETSRERPLKDTTWLRPDRARTAGEGCPYRGVLTDRPSATRIPSSVIHNPMPRLVSSPRFFKRETVR
jgi:hypothetical protein